MKNSPRILLSVAFPTWGLLSAPTTVKALRTSERRMNSWRMGCAFCPCG